MRVGFTAHVAGLAGVLASLAGAWGLGRFLGGELGLSASALGVALLVGIVLTVLEPKYHRFLPSPTAVGMGMLIPGFAIIPMVAGGVIQAIWLRASPRTEATYSMPLASGFITGEALVVLVFSVLAIFGVRI